MEEIKSYKLLDENFPPASPVKNAVIYVLNQTTNKVEPYITDKTGTPRPLKDDTGDDFPIFISSDNTLEISGTTEIDIRIKSSLISLLASALQPFDNISQLTNDAGYLTSFTETDPVFLASDAAGISAADILNWDAAFGWGNHASQGYLTDEINDLTQAVVWDTVPDAFISESSVTQHESSLTITQSQISDLVHFAPTDLLTDYGVDLTDYLTVANNLSDVDNVDTARDNLNAEKKLGVVASGNIATTFVLDHNNKFWNTKTMTADTTFSDSNLVVDGVTRGMYLTGNFVPTFPAYWTADSDSQTYDGTVRCRITWDVLNATASSEDVRYFIKVIE